MNFPCWQCHRMPIAVLAESLSNCLEKPAIAYSPGDQMYITGRTCRGTHFWFWATIKSIYPVIYDPQRCCTECSQSQLTLAVIPFHTFPQFHIFTGLRLQVYWLLTIDDLGPKAKRSLRPVSFFVVYIDQTDQETQSTPLQHLFKCLFMLRTVYYFLTINLFIIDANISIYLQTLYLLYLFCWH